MFESENRFFLTLIVVFTDTVYCKMHKIITAKLYRIAPPQNIFINDCITANVTRFLQFVQYTG